MLLEYVGSLVGVPFPADAGVSSSSSSYEDVLEYARMVEDALYRKIDRNMSDAMYIENDVNRKAAPAPGKAKGFVSFMTSSGGEKAQLGFVDRIDNSNTPFIPKYDSLSGVEGVDVEEFRKKYTHAIDCGETPPHPLEGVLGSLADLYRDEQRVPPEKAREPKTIEETVLYYIDTVEELESIAEMLAGESEIAVDLEAHNYRSFQGFCCLMQLSTRTVDIIIDVLKLRSVMGKYVGAIFADPRVVKVFHGAQSDLGWLQRDFGIYVCNLFDTGIASKILGYPSNGLAYLLEKHCNFKADKKWQLADWRIRPLQNEAIHYARADTHWLLYCYDVMRMELSRIEEPSEKGCPGILRVLEESKQMCSCLYEKELFTENSFYNLYQRMEKKSGILTERQLSVFAAIYRWRDTLARELDESPGYILPRGQLFHLAVKSPTSRKALDHTLKSKNQIILKRRDEILYLIDKALKDSSSVLKAKRAREEDTLPAVQEASVRPVIAQPVVSNMNNSLYGNLGIDIGQTSLGVLGTSTLGTMKKVPQQQKQTTQYVPPKPALPNDMHPEPEHNPEIESVPIEMDSEKAPEAEDGDGPIAQESTGALPLGTLDDDDFLPLPISKLTQKSSLHRDGNQRKSKKAKVAHAKQSSPKPAEKEQDGQPQVQSTFDPEKALSKYSFTKKQKNTGRGRGRGRGRVQSSKKEEDYSIPTGMFNPLSGLLEGKSSSKRSATQVRSGNRSSTYRKR